MAAVDLDRFDIISRSTRAKDIAGDRCAAQAVVHVNGAAREVGIGCVVVAQVVEMIVPDNKSLAARVTPAVDCSHILAVQDHVMEQVVLDHAVQRGLRIARNGEVQRDVRDVIDLIAGEGILHTAKLHTAFVERAVLVRIVDAAV